jgi:hypothetical protein
MDRLCVAPLLRPSHPQSSEHPRSPAAQVVATTRVLVDPKDKNVMSGEGV